MCSSRALVAHGGVGKSSRLSLASILCAITACEVFWVGLAIKYLWMIVAMAAYSSPESDTARKAICFANSATRMEVLAEAGAHSLDSAERKCADDGQVEGIG